MDTKHTIETKDFFNRKKFSILVVEDDEDNQLLLKHAIAMFGWQYFLAIDAVSAIAFAKEKQPDLILLDIVMPNVSGLQIACLLKKHLKTKNIPLIAVTGLVEKEQQKIIYEVGFDDYVSKPYALDDLQKAIALILNRKSYSL